MSKSERDPLVLAQIKAMIEELHNKRIQLGLTQSQVAAQIGTTQSAISEMENFSVVPTITTLSAYAKAVGLDIRFEMLSPEGLPGKYTHKSHYLQVIADVPNTVDSWQRYRLALAELAEHIQQLEEDFADLHFRIVEG